MQSYHRRHACTPDSSEQIHTMDAAKQHDDICCIIDIIMHEAGLPDTATAAYALTHRSH